MSRCPASAKACCRTTPRQPTRQSPAIRSSFPRPSPIQAGRNLAEHLPMPCTICRSVRSLPGSFAASAGKGSSRNGRITASPIVAGGRIFVLDAEARGARPFRRKAAARCGRYRWCLKAKMARERSAAAWHPMVRGSMQRQRSARRWRSTWHPARSFGGRPSATPIRSSPTIAAGRMVFATSGNQIFCLSTTDGSELWNSQGVGEQAAVIASTSPAISDDTVVVP